MIGSEATVPELRPLVDELTRSQESLSRVNVQLLDQVTGLERAVETYDRRLANTKSQCARLVELLAEFRQTNAAVQSNVNSALVSGPKTGEFNLQDSVMKVFEERRNYEELLLVVEESLAQNDVGILNMCNLLDNIIADDDPVSWLLELKPRGYVNSLTA